MKKIREYVSEANLYSITYHLLHSYTQGANSANE